MAKVLIIFSSIGGNTEMVVKKVAQTMESSGHQVDYRRVDIADPKEILNYDLTILASPTYNQGTLEDHFKPFMKSFKKIDLKNRNFGVIGLGDTKYYPEYLTEAAGILEEEIKKAGANLVTPPLRIGTNPLKMMDKIVVNWAQKVSSLV